VAKKIDNQKEHVVQQCDCNIKQGVALTGRNTTGPPCSVTVEL